MGELDDFIANWRTLLASDLWHSDEDLQARKVHELGQIRSALGEYFERAIELLSASLELPIERLRLATTLDDVADVHAALTPTEKTQPDDALFPRTGWLAEYLKFSTGNEVPTTWHFWCGMSVLATAAKRHLYVDAGNHKVWPNLYLVIVEESASKKSTAIGIGRGVVRNLNKLLTNKYPGLDYLLIPVAADSGTPQKFVDTIQSKQALVPQVIGDPQLRLMDTQAYLAADDLVTLFSKNTFAADRWIELLTHLWDYSGDWRDETLSREAVLRNPALTFVGGTTTEWIRHNVTEAMIGGGWMSRCVYVVHPGTSERLYYKAQRVDPVASLELAKQLIPLTTMPQRRWLPNDAYWSWYESWYNSYVPSHAAQSVDIKMLAYYKRRPTMLHKIAMLLGLSEGLDSLDLVGTVEHLELADAILKREEDRMPQAFTGVSAHIDAQTNDRIYNYLFKINKPIRHSDLLKNVYPLVGSAFNFRKQMEMLVEMNKVERFMIGKAVAYKLPTETVWTPGGAKAPSEPEPE